MRRFLRWAGPIMSCVLLASACRYTQSTSRSEGARQAASAPAAPAAAISRAGGLSPATTDGVSLDPPAGRWRLARPEELGKVVVWLSHILIRHERVRDSKVSFQLSDWHWPGPAPTRSRDEALRLAQRVRERAAQAPERFAELVLEFSEDPATRDFEGSLGGITADQLITMPRVLDVLQAARIGEITQVVETTWGFHILRWNHPPPLETLSGSRIVIGHDQAPWLGQSHVARGAVPRRSREEALALATRVYEQARREPERFDQLAQTYSDHSDASRSGDFGSWSSREPTSRPREVAALRRLAPGQVAPPMDSPFGFEIIRRVENRPRTVYRMAAIRLLFDVTVPDGAPNSSSQVLARTRALYAEFERDPARFDSLRAEYCCNRVSQVVEGRNPEILVSLLSRMEPGQIAPEPLRFGPAYLIPKLLDRAVHTPEADAQLALPSPDEVDFEYWVPRLEAAALEARLRLVGEQAAALPGIHENTSAQVLREHELAADLQPLSAAERVARVRRLVVHVQALLAADDQRRYQELLLQQFAKLVHKE
jgi:PPIC-type PPIASE domain